MKYIDAEKLIAYLKKTMESYKSQMVDPTKYPIDHIDLMAFLAREYQAIIANVESLQQEQPKSTNGKFVFPNFLYARTLDNKTIDVSYAPQSMDAVEYIKNDPIEQPEVDLELEIERIVKNEETFMKFQVRHQLIGYVARHFYELGLNARKEE